MERLTFKAGGFNAFNDKNLSTYGGMQKDGSLIYIGDVANKLAEYEDLEEQGLLPKLPCKVGSDVYFIPSKVNYDLNILNGHEKNNRVYHQKVARIVFTERGWHLICDMDSEYGIDHILVDKFYKETWFLMQAEAGEALKRMEGK